MAAANLLGLAKSYRQLARVPSRVSAIVSQHLSELVAADFAAGRDPYGSAWAPLAPATRRKGRTHPPLDASGRLRASVWWAPAPGAGLRLGGSPPAYGQYHLTGTRHMPARPWLPASGLPAAWKRMIEAAMRTAADEVLR
jgi:phage gpG-like protein